LTCVGLRISCSSMWPTTRRRRRRPAESSEHSYSRRAVRIEMVRLGAAPAMVRTLHATTELGRCCYCRCKSSPSRQGDSG
jgi:hypothetical protein